MHVLHERPQDVRLFIFANSPLFNAPKYNSIRVIALSAIFWKPIRLSEPVAKVLFLNASMKISVSHNIMT